MPSPGRKPVSPAVKAARGTGPKPPKGETIVEQLARDASPALSLTPPPLPDGVAELWADYVEMAIANGARQCDADAFAEWCTMAANLRAARAAAAAAPASYVAQWRMLGELFGLAGPGSRMMPKGAADAGKPENPFARNGRPPR